MNKTISEILPILHELIYATSAKKEKRSISIADDNECRKATKAIEALITEARNKALEDVKFYGYGYDDGTGFVIKISYEQLNSLKLTTKENKS